MLGGKPLYRQLEDWALQYKSLFSVTFFGQTFVVVSDQKIAKDLLSGVKSDRPNIGLIPGTRTDGKYAPLLDRGGKTEVSDSRIRTRGLTRACCSCPQRTT